MRADRVVKEGVTTWRCTPGDRSTFRDFLWQIYFGRPCDTFNSGVPFDRIYMSYVLFGNILEGYRVDDCLPSTHTQNVKTLRSWVCLDINRPTETSTNNCHFRSQQMTSLHRLVSNHITLPALIGSTGKMFEHSLEKQTSELFFGNSWHCSTLTVI
jgi:hypothetical protein